ncbi:MAG: response regulator [Rhodospirillales bacterium 69-11]|jgi:DNA-binding NtrC family response regulator|nr:response regulator [Rhodospirillales bacterium]OJW26362.1 MAG: response regulator [Rhodospirillales bacterium 69-11]
MSETLLLLLVEDDAGISEMLEDALADEGFETVIAGSAATALAALGTDASRFKCVITDVHLGPGPSGWDVARRARELEPEMPVIYMSGHRAAEWAVNGVPGSILLEKPFVPAQLITAIATLLNKGHV